MGEYFGGTSPEAAEARSSSAPIKLLAAGRLEASGATAEEMLERLEAGRGNAGGKLPIKRERENKLGTFAHTQVYTSVIQRSSLEACGDHSFCTVRFEEETNA